MPNQIGIHHDNQGGWMGTGMAGPPHPDVIRDKVRTEMWRDAMNEKRQERAAEQQFTRECQADQAHWMNQNDPEPEIPDSVKRQATWLGILLAVAVMAIYLMVYGISLLVL
jgi:hypothetical protein